MSSFSFETPDGRRVTYGHDHALGFFAEIKVVGKKRVEYDALHPGEFRFQRPLEGLLYFLVRNSVFDESELHDALGHLEDRNVGRMSRGARLAIEVVTQLKAAAAD